MPSEWNLHSARWVIEDGESDRDVGESFEWFAVEFWSESGLATAKDVNERSAVPGMSAEAIRFKASFASSSWRSNGTGTIVAECLT